MVNQQQDPSWINQQAQQQARQVVPNLYAQQVKCLKWICILYFTLGNI